MDSPEQGVRIVDDKKYYNNTSASRVLGYSPYGWRQYRDKLWKEGKLKIYEFPDDTKNSYVLEEDLMKLKYVKPVEKKFVNGVD